MPEKNNTMSDGTASKATNKATVGVLSLQGDVAEHVAMLRQAGCSALPVKTKEAITGIDGLVIPGGESTTVGKLLVRYGLDHVIRERASGGMPIFGTCTGLILLAKDVEGSDQPRLGLMDITVRRNAFGRQVDSFEVDLEVKGLEGGPVRAVFIRAPYIERVGPGVEVLAEVQGKTVMARQGQFLAAAFHPELTNDDRVHRLFVGMVEEYRAKKG